MASDLNYSEITLDLDFNQKKDVDFIYDLIKILKNSNMVSNVNIDDTQDFKDFEQFKDSLASYLIQDLLIDLNLTLEQFLKESTVDDLIIKLKEKYTGISPISWSFLEDSYNDYQKLLPDMGNVVFNNLITHILKKQMVIPDE